MRTGKRKNSLIIAMFVFGGIAILITIVAAILYFVAKEECLQKISLILGLVSTSISVILSIVATGYSFYSGEKTSKILDDIRNESETLAGDITQRRIHDAMGEKSAERILQEKINKKD